MATTTKPTVEPQNLFADIEKLRVSPSPGLTGGTIEKILSHVPVKKPGKSWFVRVHPENQLETLLVIDKDENENFLVAPVLHDRLAGEPCMALRRLLLAVNREGVPFIWPLRLPMEGRSDSWAMSEGDAAKLAESKWTRIAANMQLGAYDVTVARVEIEPRWPEEPFGKILEIAFRGKVIDTWEHPILKRLRGEE